MSPNLTRRRFIGVLAAAGAAFLPRPSRAVAGSFRTWRGAALGADASITLFHSDPMEAERLIHLCLAEVKRLEAVFSLYQAESALSRLNRDGVLEAPPADLVRLLGEAVAWGHRTEGAFDVTVQPLWQLYAGHFTRPGANPAGPPTTAIDAVRKLVDYQAMQVGPDRIAFGRAGMAVTLNGIAQGYITDRVADRLRDEGMSHVLLDLGEARALDRRPDGQPWRVGLEDPSFAGRTVATVDLEDRALATSGGYGTSLDPLGHFSHLFDPANGRCADRWASVSVLAPEAAAADALSTALAVLSEERALALLEDIPNVAARLTRPDGHVITVGL